MNQLISFTILLAIRAPHAVESFVPSYFFSSNGNSISTTSTMFYAPSGNSTLRDTRQLTIDDLKMIAFRKGYDTVGMEREGLEMIANFLDVDEDFSVEGYPPEEVDLDSLAEGFPLFGSIPRMTEEQPRILDMVPTSYNRLKTPEDTVYADLDMDFGTVESSNGIENSSPQNQFRLQSSELVTPPAQSQLQLRSDPNQSLPQLSPQSQQSWSEPLAKSQLQLRSDPNQSLPQLSPQSQQSRSEPLALLKSPSLRAFVVGFVTGVIVMSPATYLSSHTFPSEIIENESSQFLFDIVTGGISAGVFATIYRYLIQPYPNRNEDMKVGIVGAFVVCRASLFSGTPLGFMDRGMLQQYTFNAFEDLLLFGAAALVLEYACEKGFISSDQDSRKNLE